MNATTAVPKPRRRFLRFSLRTLFAVLTLFCVWLGWSVNAVHQRRAAWNEIERSGNLVVESGIPGSWPYHIPVGESVLVQIRPTEPLGWVRQTLGDRPVSAILVEEEGLTDMQLMTARRLFPEAKIIKEPLRMRRSSQPTTNIGVRIPSALTPLAESENGDQAGGKK